MRRLCETEGNLHFGTEENKAMFTCPVGRVVFLQRRSAACTQGNKRSVGASEGRQHYGPPFLRQVLANEISYLPILAGIA